VRAPLPRRRRRADRARRSGRLPARRDRGRRRARPVPEVAALLAEHGPDDHPYARLLEHLSIYLDAHWGDRAEPPPETAAFGARAIAERIARLPRVERAVELGCSAGRIVAELAAAADHVVGLDLQFGALRRARRLLDGEPVAYARRLAGRHHAPAQVRAGDRAVPASRRTLLCADVLDPPLVPGHYDRVVALNMLDSVARPRLLLSVADGLCRPGGEVILSSPYQWQSSVMEDAERIGGADPAADVAAILRGGAGIAGRYEIEEEADVSWTLRRDARSAVEYRVHYLRARKL
jgi:SAM-dependent methyltransferase